MKIKILHELLDIAEIHYDCYGKIGLDDIEEFIEVLEVAEENKLNKSAKPPVQSVQYVFTRAKLLYSLLENERIQTPMCKNEIIIFENEIREWLIWLLKNSPETYREWYKWLETEKEE